MSAATAGSPRGVATPTRWAFPAAARWLAAGAVVAAAVALRLPGLARVPGDPYYDAAVRSMGTSWHDLLFGALEPGGSVAIDKPPLDLWLQVASSKLLGFNVAALVLPEAIAGCAAVLALVLLLRRLFGLAEALAGGAALAVLPISVLTARSDTMDAVAVALALVAALLLVRGASTGGHHPLIAAGVALGLAFNVKLFQALVPVPALAVLYLAGSDLRLPTRLSRLALAGAVAAAVAMSWVVVVTEAPAGAKPWVLGSTNGSALNAVFAYNGVDRLEGHIAATESAASTPLAERPDGPGPLRLAQAGGALDRRLAPELVPALLASLLALVAAAVARRRGQSGAREPRRLVRAGALAFGTWLATGLVLFSTMADLKVRYLEAMSPAVAAALGVSVVALVRRVHAGGWTTAALLAALLAVPVQQSIALARAGDSDSERIGAMPPAELQALSSFLLAHDHGARYEVASATAVKASALVARDGRPVMLLDALAHQPIVQLPTFLTAVGRGEVRYLLMTGGCSRTCGPAVAWAMRHGRDVTRQAGLPGRGVLYALPARLARAREPAARSRERRLPQPAHRTAAGLRRAR
jgi:4-amino-4-deoxy-L-arabinose transferase-like glycosyltransferase